MSKRLKVLISAYACEPGKGSEPEIGWQWSHQIARFHDVTVLTRANNKQAITDEIGSTKKPAPHFLYHDLSGPVASLKKRFRLHKFYYLLWQRSARVTIARLVRSKKFDLIHHLTYTGARYPTATFGHGVPCLWGPVGGLESTPSMLLPWKYPRALAEELMRNTDDQRVLISGRLRRAGAKGLHVISATPETMLAFKRQSVDTTLLPFVGISPADFPKHEPIPAEHLRLIFVGRILWWRGVEFALRALAVSKSNTTLTFVGNGKFLPSARLLTCELGLERRVQFIDAMPRLKLLTLLRNFDAMIIPSLHETGGFAALEGMATGLPVICLDRGAPRVVVTDGCGIRVSLSNQRDLISHLAEAITAYANNSTLLRNAGIAARKHALTRYNWDQQGEEMNSIYANLIGE